MLGRHLSFHSPLAALVVAAALALAFFAGAQAASGDTTQQVGILVATAFVPLVLLDVSIGLAVWLVLVFAEGLPGTNAAENAAMPIIAFAWLLTGAGGNGANWTELKPSRVLLVAVSTFCVWLLLSTTWARDPQLVGLDLRQWYLAVLMFLIVASTVRDERRLRLLIGAFILGAVISAVIGFWDETMTRSATSLQTASTRELRLVGAEGDPNVLAAGLVPAIALAGGLLALTRGAPARLILVVAMGLLAVGLAGTESRGGLLAAFAAIIAAIWFVRGRRRHVITLSAMLVSLGAVWLLSSPTGVKRIEAAFRDKGSGRLDLWRVGWQMSADHPLVGVGLNNFAAESARYAREVGALDRSDLLTSLHVVHNSYLQVLTETGAVGLALFSLIMLSSMALSWRAAARFEALDRPAMATLARSCVVAVLSMLVSCVFLSNAFDKRLWFVLALGPALLAMASRIEAARYSPSRVLGPGRAQPSRG